MRLAFLQGLQGICLFFLRTTSKQITVANIAQEVTFGTIDCTGGKILASFENHLSKIILPAMKSLEVKKTILYFLKSLCPGRFCSRCYMGNNQKTKSA